MAIGEMIGIWVAAILTFMIFSFLYKDNPIFKLGEHIFLGFAIGYSWCIYYWNDIFPQAILPLYPEPGVAYFSREQIVAKVLVLIPIILAVFIVVRVVPSLAWLSRISFALLIGGWSGMAVPIVISGVFLGQLTSTMAPLAGMWIQIVLAIVLTAALVSLLAYSSERGTWLKWTASTLLAAVVIVCGFIGLVLGADVNMLLLLGGVFCTIVFFFFSLEHRGVVGRIGRVGVLFIMVSFGASFGYTVMARVSLLIGRFQFLIHDWFQGTILHH